MKKDAKVKIDHKIVESFAGCKYGIEMEKKRNKAVGWIRDTQEHERRTQKHKIKVGKSLWRTRDVDRGAGTGTGTGTEHGERTTEQSKCLSDSKSRCLAIATFCEYCC